jgi:hypothetical protein
VESLGVGPALAGLTCPMENRLRMLAQQLVPPASASPAGAASAGPLAGVKVVEMCQMISGASGYGLMLSAQTLTNDGCET